MKKTKFIIHILAISLILMFLSCFANNNVMAAGSAGLRLTKNVSGKVTPGKQVTVYARVNANNIESLQGTLVYSKELTLVSYQWGDLFKNVNDFNPSNGKAENSYKGNKILSFAAALGSDNKVSGDNIVVAMTFDTSLCERGSQYKIVWNTDSSKMLGNKTYVFADGQNIPLTETTGVVIETTGTKSGNSDFVNNVSDLPGVTGEIIEPTVNAQSGIDEDLEAKIRNAEESANNAKNDINAEEKDNNSNVQKPSSTNGANNNSQTQQNVTPVQKSNENKSDKSTEKIPQLGGQVVVYCVGSTICLLVIIFSLIEIKKMKKI